MSQANIKAVITADDRASATIGAFGGSFTRLAGAMAVGQLAAMAFNKAISMITDNIGGAIKRVDTLNNFPRVMQNLGYSTADASVEIKRLEAGVKGLPTSLDSIASAMQNIAPSSKSMAEATDLTLALNNAMLAGGKSMAVQSSAMEQFSQAISKGKPDMMEWRALATAMPGQLDQIGQSLGYGRGEWQKMAADVSSGKLSFDKVKQAIVSLNKDGLGELPSFAEQAKASTNGLETSFANMQSAITRGIGNIISAIGEENITGWITEVGKGFESVLKIVALLISGDYKGGIFGMTEDDPFIDALFKFRDVLVSVVNFIQSSAISIINGLKIAWDFLKPSFEELWKVIQERLLPSLQRLWNEVLKPLAPYIGGALVAAIWVAVNVLTEMIKFWSGVYDAVVNVVRILRAVADWVGFAFGNFIMWINDTRRAIEQFGYNAYNRLVEVVNFFKALPGNILGAVRGFGNLLYNTGRDLIQGLINGIGSIGGQIGERIKGFANDAVKTAKNILGIKSPSKVFEGIGENIGLGMIRGIDSTADAISNSLTGVTNPNIQLGGSGSMPAQPSSAKPMMASNSNTTINISLSGVFTGTPSDARKLAQMVADNLKTVAGQKNMSVVEMLG